MSGLRSRRKGSRVEYLVRDAIRLEGYKADRVPASGAAQGFKGDIKVVDNWGMNYLVEVKARKNGFKVLYAYLASLQHPQIGFYDIQNGIESSCYTVSTSFHDAMTNLSFTEILPKKIKRKLDSLSKLVKECDILAIKDDNKPVLYISFHYYYAKDQLSKSGT